MPTIAYFLGIAVSMHYRDHNPPHIHVSYQGYEALITIDDARILRGKLPPTAMLICQGMDRVTTFGVIGELVESARTCAAGADRRTGRR